MFSSKTLEPIYGWSNLRIHWCFSTLFIFFASISSAFATDTFGLRELFLRAEKNAALQKDFAAMRDLARAKLGEAEALRWLPSLNMKAFAGVVPDATIDVSQPFNTNYRSGDFENGLSLNGLGAFWRVEVEAIQPIYTFGKISNIVDAAKGGQGLASSEQRKKTDEIKLLVKRAYYTLQLSNDSKDILREVESKLSDANEKVEELLVKNAENVSEIDRLKIRVFKADVKNRALDAERAGLLSRSALSEMAGLVGDWDLDQRNLTAERPNGLKKEDIISFALRSKPELLQIEKLVEMKESEMKANRANLYPTIFVGGKIEYAEAPGRTDVTNPYLNDPFNYLNAGVILGLTQDLSIFRTMKKTDSIAAEMERLKAQKEQLSIKTKLDAEKSFEEAFAAISAMQINEEGFRAARSWLTSTGLSFSLGTSETKDVLESFAAYFKARVDLMRSTYNLNLALADLAAVSGVEVLERLK